MQLYEDKFRMKLRPMNRWYCTNKIADNYSIFLNKIAVRNHILGFQLRI